MDMSAMIHLEGREFWFKVEELGKEAFAAGTYTIKIGQHNVNHITFFVDLDQARQIIRGLAGQLRGIERGLEK